MTNEPHHPTIAQADSGCPSQPIRILGVIPPEPHYGPGTYEVRLQLSRPLTRFEVEAMRPLAHGMYAVNSVLTIYDTTLERVAAEAAELSSLVQQAEEIGRRLQRACEEREERARSVRAREAARLADVARSIRFDDSRDEAVR